MGRLQFPAAKAAGGARAFDAPDAPITHGTWNFLRSRELSVRQQVTVRIGNLTLRQGQAPGTIGPVKSELLEGLTRCDSEALTRGPIGTADRRQTWAWQAELPRVPLSDLERARWTHLARGH
eukprot:CAMPEP_0194302094 /NCGR_PEP_ID=MMETSP0169-20130528/62152_1 /TAXON_ID=218684 /ORGANISM="Corethron pennatum, Strain L29A3" /LENGTH=121 /DNA_ID=CAMNT_0039052399 /DNA_START=995 /DNA_END=1361 /DNA_ORIENTATION=+